MEEIKKQVIALYIKRVQRVLSGPKKNIFFIQRYENRRTLLDLNMTIEDMYSLLRSLEVTNYSKGPENDLDVYKSQTF